MHWVILFIIACYLYYLLIRAFFVHLAPDAIFIGSLVLSFSAPALYIKACYHTFYRDIRSWFPLGLAAYLILSMHLNFEAMFLPVLVQHIGRAQTYPGVAEAFNDLFSILPDQMGIAILLKHMRPLLPIGQHLEYHFFSVLLKSLVMSPLLLLASRMPSTLASNSNQPAHTIYFFSQAFSDMVQIVRCFYGDAQAWMERGLRAVRWLFSNTGLLLTWPLGVVGILVLIAPVVFSAVILLGIFSVHSLIVMYIVLAILLAALVLRLVEHAVAAVRWGYAKCPSCYKRVPSPKFQCPTCRSYHTRLVPGRFGLLSRRCTCKSMLPTLFGLGKGKVLPAYCPYCGQSLSIGVFSPNIHIPIVGGSTSGKSSFLSAGLMKLFSGSARPLAADFVEEKDRDQYENVWKPNFSAGVASAKTQDIAPPALLLNVGMHRPGACTLYLYDPAGEAFEEADSLARHEELTYADGAILMIDPFSMVSVQADLRGELDQADFDYSKQEPIWVFERLISMLVAHTGIQRGRQTSMPLAVVISKVDAFDLNRDIGIDLHSANSKWTQSGKQDSDKIRDWLNKCDANLVRMIEQQFSRVRYFATSAFGPNHRMGKPFEPARVLQPVTWLLSHCGWKLRRQSNVLLRTAQALLVVSILALVIGPLIAGGWLAADRIIVDDEPVTAAVQVSPRLENRFQQESRPAIAQDVIPDTLPMHRVATDSAIVYSDPDIGARHVASLEQGLTVRQIARQGDWIRIQFQEGMSGWILDDDLDSTDMLNESNSGLGEQQGVTETRAAPTTANLEDSQAVTAGSTGTESATSSQEPRSGKNVQGMDAHQGERSADSSTAPAANWYIIKFGEIGGYAKAQASASKLKDVVREVRIENVDMNGRIWHSLCSGLYESRAAAENDLARARALGFPGIVVQSRSDSRAGASETFPEKGRDFESSNTESSFKESRVSGQAFPGNSEGSDGQYSGRQIVVTVDNIDDVGEVLVNGMSVVEVGYRKSALKDITASCHAGLNEIRLRVRNRGSGYTWGFKVVIDGTTVLSDRQGVAGSRGANNNDRKTGIVFEKVLFFILKT